LGSNINKVKLAAKAVGWVAKDYQENRAYYHDFVKFNFMNGASCKSSSRLLYYNLPAEERDRVRRLYRRYSGWSVENIYRSLGIAPSKTSRSMPIETKLVYTYYIKYGSWEYHRSNRVTDAEILRPLDKEEAEDYAKLF
jgi:hypothetical protein